MTCIIDSRYKTKKDLRSAIACEGAEFDIIIEDPSIVNPRCFTVSQLKRGEEVVVTNHPKRSWFAQVGRTMAGKLYCK